jgi:uncharacterized RDD family membrane protein YckC
VIAGFWSRILALLVDMALLALVGIVIGAVAYRQVVALGQEGRLIGAAITLVYFGFFNSSLGGGATPGKRMLDLRVVGRDGNPIGLLRTLLRTFVFWTPYYLNGVTFRPIPGLQSGAATGIVVGILLAFVVFGGTGFILYLYIFNRRTRQSLHDLIAGTFVVRADSAGAPVRAHFWKGHLAFAMLACAAVAAMPIAFFLSFSGTQFATTMSKTAAIQSAVAAYPGVDTAQVTVNTFWASSFNGPSVTRTTLAVTVRMRDVPASMDAAQDDIAEIVFKTAPTILDQQYLQVSVAYGYDLGIFKWTNANGYVNIPEVWKRKLQARHVGDSV